MPDVGIAVLGVQPVTIRLDISDEMMWRYYELLTDVQIAEISRLKQESHPMQAKKAFQPTTSSKIFISRQRQPKPEKIGSGSFKNTACRKNSSVSTCRWLRPC